MTALAALLRVVGIGRRGLWLDEAASFFFADGSLASVTERLRLDSGPPLYYYLLHGWMELFGSSEAALRSLSALAGVALVVAVGWVGRRLLGGWAGMAAALLTAVSPIQVRYAQEARAYTLLALAALGALYFLYRALETERRPAAALWVVVHGLCLAAALYLHNYAFFLLPAVALYGGVEGWRHGRLGRGLAGLGLALLAYLPWLPLLLAQLANKGPYRWMSLVWEEHGAAGSLLASLTAVAPGGGAPPYVGLEPLGAFSWLGTLLLAVLLGVGAWSLGQQSSSKVAWLATYAFFPLLAVAIYSLLFDPIYLPGRLDQLVFPALCLLMAAGLGALRPPWLSHGVLALLVALSAVQLAAYYRSDEPAAERQLAAALAPRLRPGDTVVTTSLTVAPLAYELRRRPEGVELLAFPAELAEHPGNEDLEALLADRPARVAEADRLARRLTAGGRFYLALVPNQVGALLLDRLRAQPRPLRAEVLGEYEQRLIGQPVTLFEIQAAGRPRAPEQGTGDG